MKSRLLKSIATTAIFSAVALVPPSTQLASAQEDVARFPTRPITLISPFPAGTSSDLACRVIAKEAETFLGKPVILLNKPGGSATIGAAAVAAAKPDGYTIGYIAPSALFVAPFLIQVPYHPLKDFQQIIQFGETVFGASVRADTRFKDFKEVLDFARKNPQKLTYGSSGLNSILNLTFEKIAKDNGVQFFHIPYKGGVETTAGLLSGQTEVSTGDVSASLVRSGQVKPILLFTENHLSEYPGVPILKDIGYEIPFPSIIAIMAPKGLPDGIARTLENAFAKAMKEPGFIEGMKKLNFPVLYRSGKELNDYVVRNYAIYEKLVKEMARP